MPPKSWYQFNLLNWYYISYHVINICIFKWKCLLCHVNLQRMTFQALYKNVVIRRWCVCVLCVCVCVFCRSGGEFYSQTLSSRVRGCSKASLPFTISFLLLLPNSQAKFFLFFLSDCSGHYNRGKNQIFMSETTYIRLCK